MGHAYASVHADIMARYLRAAGHQAILLTGADEHGEKIAKAAMQANVDPDRASFTRGMFQLVEMLSFSLVLEPAAAAQLVQRLSHHHTRQLLPPRLLRVNRREIKQIYSKYPPKKRNMPPPEPFEPEDQFLDFVELLDPLAPKIPQDVLK